MLDPDSPFLEIGPLAAYEVYGEGVLAAGVIEVMGRVEDTECMIIATRLVPIMDAARQQGVRVRGHVSCVLGCPYEGVIHPEQVMAVARDSYAMGCYEIPLGGTIGLGTASANRRGIRFVNQRYGYDAELTQLPRCY